LLVAKRIIHFRGVLISLTNCWPVSALIVIRAPHDVTILASGIAVSVPEEDTDFFVNFVSGRVGITIRCTVLCYRVHISPHLCYTLARMHTKWRNMLEWLGTAITCFRSIPCSCGPILRSKGSDLVATIGRCFHNMSPQKIVYYFTEIDT
jgi:hypothetical protein